MLSIPLVNSPEAFWVDMEDYEAVLAFSTRWYRRPEGGVYTTRRIEKMPKKTSLAYFLLGKRVWYIDGNPLNLSRSNLSSTGRKRALRKRPRRTEPVCRNSYGLAGVQRRPSGSWTSRATVRGKVVYTGIWPTKEAAHAAYLALKAG